MIFYPAIDLKDGNCVRLYKGDMNEATVFSNNPAAQALAFESGGAEWLHLVDLNGAFAGESMNGDAVEDVLNAIMIPVQLGGGVRNMQMVDSWIDRGVARVILGTAAVRDPQFVKDAAKAHPGKVAVGIDARGGKVAVSGWAEETDITAVDLAKQFEDAGVAAIIYTDIDRDGAMEGPNVKATADLANAVSIPVIASGGVSSMNDLQALKACGAPLNGAISGRAVYDGVINLSDAVSLLAG